MDRRESVRAKSLKEVMEKIMEKEHPPKSNIPQLHSAAPSDFETLKKIRALQQKLELLSLLRVRLTQMEDGQLKTSLKDLIAKEEALVDSLKEDLRDAQGPGEQWFMLIGDYGGGSFKLMLCDLAAEETNSFQGGYVIGEMLAKDTYNNLKTVFGVFTVRFLLLLLLSFFLLFKGQDNTNFVFLFCFLESGGNQSTTRGGNNLQGAQQGPQEGRAHFPRR